MYDLRRNARDIFVRRMQLLKILKDIFIVMNALVYLVTHENIIGVIQMLRGILIKNKLKIAYADPPYMGCAHRYPEKKEVDHQELINELMAKYDRWALSCHTPSLQKILAMCPQTKKIRVMSWVKPYAIIFPTLYVQYQWEPVIVYNAYIRKCNKKNPAIRDWIKAKANQETGMIGSKPKNFCIWLYQVLGITKEDEFFDLYPGSGALTKYLKEYLSDESLQKLSLGKGIYNET